MKEEHEKNNKKMIKLECTNLTNDTAKENIEEQIGKATKAKIDPTSRITNKIQKKLCKLRKENKFTNNTYFELYPSDPIPPRLYGTIKTHKQEKTFPCESLHPQQVVRLMEYQDIL